jgi:hypothetical protein
MHAGVAVMATQPATDGRQRAGRGWLLLLLSGYLLQVGWRVYLSWPITGPIAHADEDGYMFGARVLAGGADATLPSWSIMRPIGYPLVLTPAFWLADQPVHVYQIIHAAQHGVLQPVRAHRRAAAGRRDDAAPAAVRHVHRGRRYGRCRRDRR